MLKLNFELRAFRLLRTQFEQELEKRAIETVTEAAFTWVATAISIIPVWSGASRATFEKLAGDISFQIDNTPRSNAPDGRAEGRSASDGGTDFNRTTGKYSFEYSTTLAHLTFNEVNDANRVRDPNLFARLIQPGPYSFVEQANDAARPVIEEFRPPNVGRFIQSVRVK